VIRHLLGFLLQYGVFGLVLLGIADDSFLFLPIGADLLIVLLVARHHNQLLADVLGAAAGSTLGVLLLDLVCRKGGEKGLTKLVKPRMLNYLKHKMERHGAGVLIVSGIAPPPFPFGAAIAVASALQYPRWRLLGLVGASRMVRYGLIGWAAIHFGRGILRIANSKQFLWAMGVFIAFCVGGSVLSVVHWVRMRRSRDSGGDSGQAPEKKQAGAIQ
jgi:membrane protein YqaA with SNARE-associated domain